MDSQGFGENSRLRASDADRDRAAAVLNSAMAEGRLTAQEHSERLDGIYAAKTHADIVPLLDDLPGPGIAARPDLVPAVDDSRSGERIIAILGGATRKGSWHATPVMHVITVMGGAEIDFRDAVLPGGEITLSHLCVLGGLAITVPPEMRVIDSGIAIMGGRETAGDSQESAGPSAPVLRITGTCIMGGIEIRRKSRKARKPAIGG